MSVPPKFFEVAVIKWLDAFKQTGEVAHQDIRRGGMWILTAGIVISNDKESISVCADYDENADYRDITTIPKKYIKRLKIIKVPVKELK